MGIYVNGFLDAGFDNTQELLISFETLIESKNISVVEKEKK